MKVANRAILLLEQTLQYLNFKVCKLYVFQFNVNSVQLEITFIIPSLGVHTR